MSAQGGIGVFDSGIGGLTVVQRLLDVLPAEEILYVGDTARSPYGTKSPETVAAYSFEIADFLAKRGIKALVVACNSASAVALDALRERMSVPVLGVIEPGARAAVEASRNGSIGVIGTEATITSGAYTKALRRLRPEVEIFTRACPLFVPLAEEGWTGNDVARAAAHLYLDSLKSSGIDALILGCTHYPLLKGVIGEIMGADVALVDSAEETAREVARVLDESGTAAEGGPGGARFFVTDVPDRFVRVGERFLGDPVTSVVRMETP